MDLIYSPSVLILFCLLITVIPKTKSDSDDDLRYISNDCSDSITFPPNSTFNSTINTLLQDLSSNATANPTGFYTTSVHDNTVNNTLNGYFLCRGDLDNSACYDCVSIAAQEIVSVLQCPDSKLGTLYYNKCMIRYSNETLLGVLALEPYHNEQSYNVIPGSRRDFTKLLGETFPVLATRAANNVTGKKFATISVPFTPSTNLYALAQCTPDLTVANCHTCLTNAIDRLQTAAGWNFLMPSCNIRYEIYPFTYRPHHLPLSPPPSGSAYTGMSPAPSPLLPSPSTNGISNSTNS
ncbi:hypothetical protein SOVF_094740, partial [Spinacia oleracea]